MAAPTFPRHAPYSAEWCCAGMESAVTGTVGEGESMRPSILIYESRRKAGRRFVLAKMRPDERSLLAAYRKGGLGGVLSWCAGRAAHLLGSPAKDSRHAAACVGSKKRGRVVGKK